MKDGILILLLIFGFSVLALVFCAIVVKIRRWLDDIKIVRMEMLRADDWEEYVELRREYRVLLLSLIPGLNPERIERIRHYFRRRRKRKNKR